MFIIQREYFTEHSEGQWRLLRVYHGLWTMYSNMESSVKKIFIFVRTMSQCYKLWEFICDELKRGLFWWQCRGCREPFVCHVSQYTARNRKKMSSCEKRWCYLCWSHNCIWAWYWYRGCIFHCTLGCTKKCP